MPKSVIDKWIKQKYLTLDGYSSTTTDESVARNFMARAETMDNELVLLVINMVNESQRHYFQLNKPEYTPFPEENEVLL